MTSFALLALALSTLAGCGASRGRVSRSDPDRACISWAGRRVKQCRAWEYRWAEDAQTPADKIEEDAARETARREGRSYIPPKYKHETAQDYLTRMEDERRRMDAHDRSQPFIPSQRSGESFDHYSKRVFDEASSSSSQRTGSSSTPQSSSFSTNPPSGGPSIFGGGSFGQSFGH